MTLVTADQPMMQDYSFNRSMMKTPKKVIVSTICKGPNTFNSCAVIKWNNSISYPIQSGHGCIGCAEPNFWDYGPLYSHIPYVHGIGIEATADKIGAGLSAVALGGVLAHAVVTNIQKHKLIKNQMDDLSINEEDFDKTESHLKNEKEKIEQKIKTEETDKL